VADTSIGTARIDVVVDSEKAEATVKRMGRSVDDFSKSAQQQYNQLATAEKKRVDGLLEQARGLVLNKARQAEFNSQLKLSGPLLDEFNRLLAQNATRAAAATAAFSILTAGAVAAGVLFLAWKKGSEEAVGFNKALILTGNLANTTAKEVAVLAEEMDNLAGVTQHSAAAALTQVVASGEFTEEQFKQVATAAELMRSATGKSIQQTIQEFAKIKGDPVKALLEFNEKQRFLTQAQLDNIRTLKAQGREAAAVTEAFRIYYDVQTGRAGEVVASLGTVEQAWRGIKKGISETIDTMLQFGREGTRASIALERALRAMPFAGGTFGWVLDKGREGAKADFSNVNAGPVVDSERARAAIKALEDREKAQKKFFEDGLSYGSKREQLEQSILQMIADGQAAGISADKLRLRAAQMRAEAEEKASGGKSGGKQKALPDFAKDAQKELERLLETEARARDQFNAMAATLDGPLAAAQYRYQEEQAKLNELAKAGAIDADSLARAQANLSQAFEAEKEALEAQLNPAAQLIDHLREQLRLRQLTNAEAQTAIDLAHLAVPATQAEAAEILALNQKLEDQAKATEAVDDFRRSFADGLASIADRSKSAKEAVADFFDELYRQSVRALSNQVTQALFGQQGQSGGGLFGGFLSSILGGGSNGSWSGGTYTYAGDFGFEAGGAAGDTVALPALRGRLILGTLR